jgi:hypothetical protein
LERREARGGIGAHQAKGGSVRADLFPSTSESFQSVDESNPSTSESFQSVADLFPSTSESFQSVADLFPSTSESFPRDDDCVSSSADLIPRAADEGRGHFDFGSLGSLRTEPSVRASPKRP